MKAYDFTGVLLGMVCCAMSIFLLPAKAAAQSPSTEEALYQELRESWDDIFPTGNRNAGGAMFFKHILENYHDLNEFMIMSRFYCPVSGSFVDPAAQPEFVYVEDDTSGRPICGSFYRCCWPCSCDIMRMTKVKRTVLEFSDGPAEVHLFVIENPCAKPDFPPEISRAAFCDGQNINEANVHAIDNDIVIGVLHDSFECSLEQVAWIGLHRVTGGQCLPRNQTPVDQLQGGMGDIFVRLAD